MLRDICTMKGIVLIFDECTSGFRETYGGRFNIFGIYPDVCMYGKALGNGYAITAVVGVKEVMRSVTESFISSTFWTEAVGPTAACATLREMKRLESWKILPKIGSSVKSVWLEASMEFRLPIKVEGIDALPTFTFLVPDPFAYKTLFTEKMLELGFLASTAFYPSAAHTPDLVGLYKRAVCQVFPFLADIFHSSTDPALYLSGARCSPTFKRLA